MKKRVLVTGVNSYIGNAFRSYMEQYPEEAVVDGISVRNDAWKTLDFSGYDCIFDVAGIAHADTGHVSEEVKKRYYAVNCDLTVALAQKAKEEGVRQFIFMSSAIVYGDSAPIGFQRMITRDTPPAPADFYGDSKLQAEKGILPLVDDHFKIAVLRPPMIYGKGSKGNYPVLSKMAQKLPAFPKVENCRSKLVQMIAEAHGKHIILVGGCTVPLRFLSQATGLVNKAFGSLAYDMSMSEYKENYRRFSLEESIRLTEG